MNIHDDVKMASYLNSLGSSRGNVLGQFLNLFLIYG